MSVGVKTVFKQNNTAVSEVETSMYLLLNANIGGDLKIAKQTVELSFGVTNLLDKKYVNHLSRLKQDGIYNMGRNFVVNLRIPFEFKKN